MKISFDEIPSSGLDLNIQDHSWFPDDELLRTGGVDAKLHLDRVGNRVVMVGTMSVEVELQCDRCLGVYKDSLSSEFTICFDLVDRKEAESEECWDRNEDMDTVEVYDPIIDVFSTLTQQVYLIVPIKRICKETCKGLCYQCGKNLNSDRCVCSGKVGENAFSILAKLKDS